MSSAGQIVGGVVGGVVGFFAGGNVMLGASIGMAIGGYIDPPKGAKGRPPSASDLAVQTATYGAPLSRGYGTYATMGNVFWVEGNTLRAEEVEAEGGKGGAPAGPSTYAIYGTFAVGFGEGEIDGYGRIWCSGKLVADYSASSLTGIIATSENGGTITLYLGGASQLPDDRIQADMGAANTPAYRGLHYIVFKDWPMADYGNTLMGMQVKAEIIRNGEVVSGGSLVSESATPSLPLVYIRSFRLASDRIIETGSNRHNDTSDMVSIRQICHVFGSSSPTLLSEVSIDPYTDAFFHAKHQIYIDQTDIDCVILSFYKNTPSQVIALDRFGYLLSDSGLIDSATFPSYPGRAVIDRNEIFFSDNGEKVYKIPFAIFSEAPAQVVSSSTIFYAEHFGVSENYIFLCDGSTSGADTSTVIKLDRVTLDVVETYTQSVRGTQQIICVVSDSEFYTLPTSTGDASIFRWIDGVAEDTGMRYSAGRDVDARLMVVSPTLAYVVKDTAAWEIYACWVGNQGAMVQLSDIISAECALSGLLGPDDIDVTDIDQEVRGYKISGVTALRASLEPLQAAWPFDVIPHGYKVKCVRRGKSSIATIDIDELGCVAGNDNPGVRVTSSREMDSQLPRRVSIGYLDVSREYDMNTGPGAERLNTEATNVEQIELAIVMNADEAAQKEEIILYMRWLDRYDASFVLPPTRLNLEASDVVTVSGNGATYELRLTSINYLPDGRLECTAKFNNAAVYTSTAVGQAGLDTGQVLSIAGPSRTILLDIPCVDSSLMDRPALLAGMSEYSSGWPGGVLMRSDDVGQTWASIQSFSTPQMTSGLAITALPSGVTHLMDVTNSLTLWLDHGTLSSVSDATMFAGANHFAVGVHGRWEILAARTVTLNGDGSYTLSNMMRGLFGTEWAMGLHAANDHVVLLDYAALRLIGMDISSINIERLWRGVTIGKSIDSTTDINLTYTGVNLECLSPIYVRGARSATNDWAIDWVRRTRVGWEWRDYVDAGLGEMAEAYDVEIYGESGYTTLKRTISGLSSSAASYTSAQQVSDFGSVQSTIYVKVYQLSAVVGRGYPVSETLNASVATAVPPYLQQVLTDPYWANVVLAMHMDGSNGGTTFTDVKGHTISRANATTSTVKYKYGTASGLFEGNTTYYLQTPAVSDFLFGSGNFTVDFWINLNNTTTGKVVGIWSDTSGVGFSWDILISSTSISLLYSTTGANATALASTGLSIGTLAWKFIEVSRSGTNIYFFVNGVKVATHTGVSATFYAVASSKLLEIGRDAAGPAYPLNAYLDDLRITKGVCRHDSDYTPPTQAFFETA